MAKQLRKLSSIADGIIFQVCVAFDDDQDFLLGIFLTAAGVCESNNCCNDEQ